MKKLPWSIFCLNYFNFKKFVQQLNWSHECESWYLKTVKTKWGFPTPLHFIAIPIPIELKLSHVCYFKYVGSHEVKALVFVNHNCCPRAVKKIGLCAHFCTQTLPQTRLPAHLYHHKLASCFLAVLFIWLFANLKKNIFYINCTRKAKL